MMEVDGFHSLPLNPFKLVDTAIFDTAGLPVVQLDSGQTDGGFLGNL